MLGPRAVALATELNKELGLSPHDPARRHPDPEPGHRNAIATDHIEYELAFNGTSR